MSKTNRLLVHLLFWAIHIVFTLYAWDLSYYKEGHLFLFLQNYIISQVTTLAFFYANYFLLVPHFLIKKKYHHYLLSLSLCLGCFAVLKGFIWNGFTFIEGLFLKDQIGPIVFTCLFYYVISTAFCMFEYWLRSEQRKIQLQQEVKETELLYLKSQMSPHFLFNTLNNIYGLSLNNDPQTSLSIHQLKDLMIYVEKFESGEDITMQEEISYLNSFVALHQLRHLASVNFKVKSTVDLSSIHIEPMLFLPFIENAFKHGNTHASHGIDITLTVATNYIQFNVKNKLSIQKRKDAVGGIGIKNVKRRLELLYRESFSLQTVVKDNEFISDLILKLS